MALLVLGDVGSEDIVVTVGGLAIGGSIGRIIGGSGFYSTKVPFLKVLVATRKVPLSKV